MTHPKEQAIHDAAAQANQGGQDGGPGSVTETMVNSASDQRTVNNVMRHAYRILSEEEKAAMQILKDMGLEFHDYLESLGTSRELSLAKTKIEEAVMWAVKHLTA